MFCPVDGTGRSRVIGRRLAAKEPIVKLCTFASVYNCITSNLKYKLAVTRSSPFAMLFAILPCVIASTSTHTPPRDSDRDRARDGDALLVCSARLLLPLLTSDKLTPLSSADLAVADSPLTERST